jgi:predicted N-acetyltransferase YhbS
MAITYDVNPTLSPAEFVDVLERSTLARRRPVDDAQCIAGMVTNADLTLTARDGDVLVGVSRSVTDFTYCCYISDLAVDEEYQGRGIGRELIRRTRAELRPTCMIILLSAPAATGYYPRLGFERSNEAWLLRPGRYLRP